MNFLPSAQITYDFNLKLSSICILFLMLLIENSFFLCLLCFKNNAFIMTNFYSQILSRKNFRANFRIITEFCHNEYNKNKIRYEIQRDNKIDIQKKSMEINSESQYLASTMEICMSVVSTKNHSMPHLCLKKSFKTHCAIPLWNCK